MRIVHVSLHFSHHFRLHPLHHPGQDCWSKHQHSLSLTLSSFTYLYLSRLVGVVHQNPGERCFCIFYQLLAGAPQEFLGRLSSTARSVPVHGSPLFLSHPTQIHCCRTIRWRATHFYNMDWTLWRE